MRSRRQTSSPSRRGSITSSTTRSTSLLGEPAQRLLAVARLDDPVSLPLERIGEQLLDRLLVVDQHDCGVRRSPDGIVCDPRNGVLCGAHRAARSGADRLLRPVACAITAASVAAPARRRPVRRGSHRPLVSWPLYALLLGVSLLVPLVALLTLYQPAAPLPPPTPLPVQRRRRGQPHRPPSRRPSATAGGPAATPAAPASWRRPTGWPRTCSRSTPARAGSCSRPTCRGSRSPVADDQRDRLPSRALAPDRGGDRPSRRLDGRRPRGHRHAGGAEQGADPAAARARARPRVDRRRPDRRAGRDGARHPLAAGVADRRGGGDRRGRGQDGDAASHRHPAEHAAGRLAHAVRGHAAGGDHLVRQHARTSPARTTSSRATASPTRRASRARCSHTASRRSP